MTNNISINDIIIIDNELAIKWNDNIESYLSNKMLREKCPCANCSGEKDVFGNLYLSNNNQEKVKSNVIINVMRVGHYAIRIYWGDGHSEGLYPYDLLRKLSD